MKIVYQKPKEITLRDIILVRMYLFGSYAMKYSGNEEEMTHFKFLIKYGLV